MRNGVTDFESVQDRSGTYNAASLQNFSGSDALGALSEGIDDVLDLRHHPRSWSFKIVNRSQNKVDHDCVNIPVSPIRPGYRLRSWIRVENVLAYRRMDILLRLPLSCSMCCRNLCRHGCLRCPVTGTSLPHAVWVRSASWPTTADEATR
jgi:hypothetical protein